MNSSSIILVLSCLGIAQALFLCSYLFSLKKGNKKAHAFLALLILGLTIRIGKSVLNEYIHLEAWQRNLGLAGILLVGPSLWLYGRTVLFQAKIAVKNSFPHFIPYILFSLFCFAIPNRFDTLSLGIYYAVFSTFWYTLFLRFSSVSGQKTIPRKRFCPGIGIWSLGWPLSGYSISATCPGSFPFILVGPSAIRSWCIFFRFYSSKNTVFNWKSIKGSR